MANMLMVIPYYSDGSGGPPEPHFFPAGATQARDVALFFANQDPYNFIIYSIASPRYAPRRVYPDGQGAVPEEPVDDHRYFRLGERVNATVEGVVYHDGTGKIGGIDGFIGVMVDGDDGTRAFVSVHKMDVEPYGV